jgi:hypothetical protein
MMTCSPVTLKVEQNIEKPLSEPVLELYFCRGLKIGSESIKKDSENSDAYHSKCPGKNHFRGFCPGKNRHSYIHKLLADVYKAYGTPGYEDMTNHHKSKPQAIWPGCAAEPS